MLKINVVMMACLAGGLTQKQTAFSIGKSLVSVKHRVKIVTFYFQGMGYDPRGIIDLIRLCEHHGFLVGPERTNA
jgi:hypothetical protein